MPGEEVFRGHSGEPSADATYCITVANEGKTLTHCSIAVIVRRTATPRSANGARPDLGPPFGLDEFTEAVLRPEASRAYQDGVVPYYIGELKTHDRVHFLELRGQEVSKNLERIGVVLFSDQMTVVGDPNPGFQEVRDNHLSQAGSNVENQRTPRNEAPSQRMPTSRRPAGPQSSKRSKANGARGGSNAIHGMRNGQAKSEPTDRAIGQRSIPMRKERRAQRAGECHSPFVEIIRVTVVVAVLHIVTAEWNLCHCLASKGGLLPGLLGG